MRRFQRGYTLLELMLVVAIGAILTSIAIPGLGRAVQANAGMVVMNEMARTLSMARAQAVQNSSFVTLCPSNDGITCGGDWMAGTLLFTDANRDRVINGNDRLLRDTRVFQDAGVLPRTGASRPAGTLTLRSFPNRQFLQFNALGFTHGQNGSFTWCPAIEAPELAQQLIFSQSGRARMARDSNGDGLREGANGQPLPCN